MNVTSLLTSFRTGLHGFLDRKDSLLGMNARNLEIIFPNNHRRDFPLVDDKVVAKELMIAAGIAVPRTYDVLEGFPDLVRLDRILRDHEEFVLKPACGSGGKGIFLAAQRVPGGVRTASGRLVTRQAVRQHMAETLFGNFSTNRSDKVLVEERLHPHPFFRDFHPVGLADIRVIVFRGKPVMSMLRLPTVKSGGTANLHQGGVGVGIDIVSGRTTRVVCRGDALEKHPDSGKALLGAGIPAWESILDVASRAASQVPLGYVGVDIVMGPDERPVVLELNARPGLQIQNATGTGLRRILTGEAKAC